VYELGSTYLKLRSILNLNEPMPEVDPAIYNIRFASHLSFGDSASTVASDASRLVRRFRADWMTQGRRPAGVCGACLILAARMNNFLRTPEEVAQVVKVSPGTIRKRLTEFAGTEMAGKTVKEWREMRDEDLEVDGVEDLPPVVKAANLKAEMIRIEALRKEKEKEEKESQEAGEQDEDDVAAKKKKRGRGEWSGRERDEDTRDMDGLIQAAAEEFAMEEGEDDDPDDRDLGSLEKSEYLDALKTTVHETPEEKEERIVAARAFKKANRTHDDNDYSELAALVDSQGGEGGAEDEGMEEDEEDEDAAEGKEDEEQDEHADIDNEKGDGEGEAGEGEDENPRPKKKRKPPFTNWDDHEAVITHMTDTYFIEEKQKEIYPKEQLRKRVEMFIHNRDPQVVAEEMNAVRRAKRDADIYSRTCRTEDMGFGDAMDEELERIYGMADDAKFVRARMWLSTNKKWMEQDKGEFPDIFMRMA
jgi:transcription factor IIIB subunit 2